MNKDFYPFRPTPAYENTYSTFVNKGKSYLSNKKIIVTGIARDIEKFLIPNIDKLNFLEEAAAEVQYFIYENDSRDSTVSCLDHLLRTKNNFQFMSQSLNTKKFGPVKDKERTHNLASARTFCYKYIKTYLSNYDYVITLDLDYDYLEPLGILNSFGHFSDKSQHIDSICGNTYLVKKEKQQYQVWNYDSFAFRLNHWDSLDSMIPDHYIDDPNLWFGLWRPPVGSSLIPIYSGFGGCSIYKADKYLQGEYSGTDCEHVMFHKSISLKSNFRLYLNPSQIMITRE